MSVSCPVCKKDDKIQKVTAIYSAGTANSSYAGTTTAIANHSGYSKSTVVGGVTTMHGITQTGLAQRLAPPHEPQPESVGCIWYVAPFIPYADIVMIFLAPISKKVKYFMAGCFVVAIILGIILATGGQRLILLEFPIGAAIIAAVIGYYWGLKQESEKRILEFHQSGYISQWETATRKWNELYYCSRDDCVFDPAANRALPLNKLGYFLYPYTEQADKAIIESKVFWQDNVTLVTAIAIEHLGKQYPVSTIASAEVKEASSLIKRYCVQLVTRNNRVEVLRDIENPIDPSYAQKIADAIQNAIKETS